MFRGLNNINVDAKGRLAIPTSLRTVLRESSDGKLVVTIDTQERCLLLYPLPEWEEVQAVLMKKPNMDESTRRLQRLLIGYANDVEMDGQGRILIPQHLRDYADIGKKATLVGQSNKFEVWSETAWTERRDKWLMEIEMSTDQPASDNLSDLSI